MGETKCPMCSKNLVNGECVDCGYKVDNHVMPNQQPQVNTSNYTQNSVNAPSYVMYEEYTKNSKPSKTKDNVLIIFTLLSSMFLPIIGLVLAIICFRSSDSNKKRVGKVALIINAVMFILLFLPQILDLFAMYF